MKHLNFVIFWSHLLICLILGISQVWALNLDRERPRNMQMAKTYNGVIGEIMVKDIQDRVEEMDSPRKGKKDLKKLAIPRGAIKDNNRRPSSIQVPAVEREVGGERNMQEYNRNGVFRW